MLTAHVHYLWYCIKNCFTRNKNVMLFSCFTLKDGWIPGSIRRHSVRKLLTLDLDGCYTVTFQKEKSTRHLPSVNHSRGNKNNSELLWSAFYTTNRFRFYIRTDNFSRLILNSPTWSSTNFTLKKRITIFQEYNYNRENTIVIEALFF